MEDKVVIKLLQEQNELLRELLVAQNKPKLGWTVAAPDSFRKLYVGRNGSSCLYSLDSENVRVPMRESTVTGYITELVIDNVIRRNKETTKLNVSIRTDEATYLISGGTDTFYAKSLLVSFAALSAATFLRPITLSFSPGKEETVVWCKVFAPDYVKVEVVANRTPIEELARIASAKIHGYDSVAEELPPAPQKNAVVATTQPNGLYPTHEKFVNKLCRAVNCNQNWLNHQLRALGATSPTSLEPDKLKILTRNICIEYAVQTHNYYDLEKAANAYDSKINFFLASGKLWGKGVMAFIEACQTHQPAQSE